MINYITFEYKHGLISLGKILPFGANTDTTFYNYYSADDELYTSLLTLDIKNGDTIYWDKPNTVNYPTNSGLPSGTKTRSKVGLITGTTLAGRLTSSHAVGEDLYQANVNSKVNLYVIRDVNLSGRYIYSYPLTSYVGAATYSDSILSLFFERTSGMIDEVRLNITKDKHNAVLKQLLIRFRRV